MERLKYILQQYAAGTATAEEAEELAALLKQAEHDEAIKGILLEQSYDELPLQDYNVTAVDNMIRNILRAKLVPIKRRRFSMIRIAAAAAVVGVVASGIWFLTRDNVNQAQGDTPVAAVMHDVEAPGVAKATITLADGRIVSLDSVTNGTLAMQGDVKLVTNSQGELVYENQNSAQSKVILYNTLSNPRGSKVISLTLADGSKVWLNAESSLRFPVSFVGDERRVQITGEAYFEVQTQLSETGATKLPFVVDANGVLTEVLGTHFNVNAYQGEAAIKVTLLEGSVKVKSAFTGHKSEKIIKPGEQALAVSNGELTMQTNADLEQVMAWKNNEFIFEHDNLSTIMRELARWYDINPVIIGNHSRQYVGRINRTVKLSEVLQLFERVGHVKFEIKGKEVRVIETE